MRSWNKEDDETDAGKERAYKFITNFIDDFIKGANDANTETEDLFGDDPPHISEVLANQRAKPNPDGSTRFSIKQEEFNRWNSILDDYEAGNISPGANLTVLERTPEVLKRIGADDLPITMRGGILQKITGEIETKDGQRHGIPVSELRNLQIELDNPIAVFDSITQPDSLVVLTRMIDKKNNERAVVALRLDGKGSKGHNINAIASAYGKKKDAIKEWIARGRLRYINKQARKDAARWLQLPGDATLRARHVLTEKDFTDEQLGHIVPYSAASRQGGNGELFSAARQGDAEYLDAVERGDMEEAQKMVREAAARAMPRTKVVDGDALPKIVYHGTGSGGFTEFNTSDGGVWMAESSLYSDQYKNAWGAERKQTYELFADITNPIDLREIDRDSFVAEYRDPETGEWVPTDALRQLAEASGVPVERLLLIAEEHAEVALDGEHPYSIIRTKEFQDSLKQQGYDGIVQTEGGGTETYCAFSPEQVKSAAPVTYDDAGNVIPLSQRFNTAKGDTRYSVPGVFTGSGADYANRDEYGNIANPPSLHYVGTGEHSQVYGWGLYGSTVRGVAESYASGRRWLKDGRAIEPSPRGNAEEAAAFFLENADADTEAALQEAKELLAEREAESPDGELTRLARETVAELEKNAKKYRRGGHIYEQTFFTDRAPGDESHLLNWYEPVSEEQFAVIGKAGLDVEEKRRTVAGETIRRVQISKDGELLLQVKDTSEITGQDLYGLVAKALGSPQSASEFLARAGIDGVKYPVASYGKTVKDGNAAGWNYVSFRDDNIRVDHKWTDGNIRYSIAITPEIRLATTVSPIGMTREKAELALIALAGKNLKNDETGIEAKINVEQRGKILSNAATRKSLDNGFTVQEHNAAVSIIKTLWKYATLAKVSEDRDNDPNIASIKRFVAPLFLDEKPAYAYITAKESVEHGHRIYSLEMEKIEALAGMLRDRNHTAASASSAHDTKYSASRQGDAEYLDAVKRGDMEEARRMVDEQLKARGFNTPVSIAADEGNLWDNAPGIYGLRHMPTELAQEIASWKVRSKSPYSNSFYNSKEITWDYKPDRSLRVSDHWNFWSRGKQHCVTDRPVENGTKWVLAEYHAEDGKYHVLKEYDEVDANRTSRQLGQAYREYYRRAIRSLIGKKVKVDPLGKSEYGSNQGVLKGVEDDPNYPGHEIAVVEMKPSGKILRENASRVVDETNVIQKLGRFGWNKKLRKGAEDLKVAINPTTGDVKSAAPVTYDDAGNVIPLSQRFNAAKEDTRYSIASTLATRRESTAEYIDSKGTKRTLHVEEGNRKYGMAKVRSKHCVDFGTAWNGGFTLDELNRYENEILQNGKKKFDRKTGRRTITWKSPEGITFTISTFVTGKGRNAREIVNTIYTDRNTKKTKRLGTQAKENLRGQPSAAYDTKYSASRQGGNGELFSAAGGAASPDELRRAVARSNAARFSSAKRPNYSDYRDDKPGTAAGGAQESARSIADDYDNPYPAIRNLSDDELVASALAVRMALGKSPEERMAKPTQHHTYGHLKIKTVADMLASIHPDWDQTRLAHETWNVSKKAWQIARGMRGDMDKGVSESLIVKTLPKNLRNRFGMEMGSQARRNYRPIRRKSRDRP